MMARNITFLYFQRAVLDSKFRKTVLLDKRGFS